MPDFEILSWHWWIIAIVLMMIEVMISGAFFLWIGIAAAFVGGLVFLIPSLTLVFQVFIFGGIFRDHPIILHAESIKIPTHHRK